MPAGVCEAARRFGRLALERLVAPAAALARDGVELNPQQAYIVEILAGIVTSTPESAALFAPDGRLLRAGDDAAPAGARRCARAARGARASGPFYDGDIARGDHGLGGASAAGMLTARRPARLRGRRPRSRSESSYRGRRGAHQPAAVGGWDPDRPRARRCSTPSRGRRSMSQIVEVMERTQRERTPEFLDGLDDPEFVARFLAGAGGPLGSTTHIAVLDCDGWACSVTCSNGSASGVIVPGTGVHLNNMLGEQDLNPLGFHRHPPGRRMPSMMAPTIVLRERRPPSSRSAAPARTGSARRSCRRSSARSTTGCEAATRCRRRGSTWEDDVVYAEPGIDTAELEAEGRDGQRVPRPQPVLRRRPGRRARRRRALLRRRRPPSRRRMRSWSRGREVVGRCSPCCGLIVAGCAV